MIEKLMSNSRTTEVEDASVRMIGAYKKTSLNSDAHLASIFTSLENESAELSSAIKRMKTESILEEKDELRDQNLRSLFYLAQGFVHHPDPEVKAAANVVTAVLNNYGLSKVIAESYASESSLISSLLSDLAVPDLQTAIAALSGCAELITELQASEDNFEATRIAYEEEKAKEGTHKNATALKKQVVSTINDQLLIYIQAMFQVDVHTYGNLTRTILQIIADNNEMVKKRKKKPEPVV